MADSAVKVAVRVRPFNAREQTEGAVLCVEMDNNRTSIVNPESGQKRDFFFDYCYWSHDQFVSHPETGVLSPTSVGGKYAD
jgi:hypothetical protein